MSMPIEQLFREDARSRYDFSASPELIRLENREKEEASVSEEGELARWTSAEDTMLQWASDKRIFSREYVERSRRVNTLLFERVGPLRGNVLDVGGGWGLFRLWWEPEDGDLFVVHDPGVQRFLHGPHDVHREIYERAFTLPMTFVEGFGEDLPYEPDVFDVAMICSAIDHFLNPAEVLKGLHDKLKPGGRLLIVQHCEMPSRAAGVATLLRKIPRMLLSPSRIVSAVYSRLSYEDKHMYHFTRESLSELIEGAGFTDLSSELMTDSDDTFVFQARKERSTG